MSQVNKTQIGTKLSSIQVHNRAFSWPTSIVLHSNCSFFISLTLKVISGLILLDSVCTFKKITKVVTAEDSHQKVLTTV